MIPKIALVLGTTFTGKSWAAGWIAAHIRRKFVIILHVRPDPSYLHHLPRARTRFVAVRSSHPRISTRFLEETRRKYRYLYISVYDLDPQETQEFLRSLVAAVKEMGNLALMIDEAHLFCSRFQVPRELIGFIRGARFFGVDVGLVTHRLRDVDVGIRCVLTHLILFRTVEHGDLAILENELSLFDAAERIRRLPDRKYIFVDRRTGYISPPRRILG